MLKNKKSLFAKSNSYGLKIRINFFSLEISQKDSHSSRKKMDSLFVYHQTVCQ